MYFCRGRPRYVYDNGLPDGGVKKNGLVPLALFLAAASILSALFFLRSISTQIAVSNAEDIVTMAVNNAVNDIMSEGGYGYDYFVQIQKNDAGEIAAVSTDMAHINTLSTEILDKVIHSTESGTLTVDVPAGNLTGSSLLMGRGPKVPIKIIYLTSSSVDFKNSIASAGINQTKLQLSLEITVDVDVLIPWSTKSSSIVTDVLVADTVVVGKVPDTFVNME
jgi:sporulation protein YunB